MNFLETKPLLFDGAMGTYLFKLGVPQNSCLEELVLKDPQKILAIHQAYKEAGAQIIRTHTFGANRCRLENHKLSKQVRLLCEAACSLARQAEKGNGVVAGSVGPTGIQARENPAQAAIAFDEQIEALARGGVDFLILETFTSLFEARLAARSCRNVAGLPFILTFSPGPDLKLHDGTPAAQALFEALNEGALAVGLNCVAGGKILTALLEKEPELKEIPFAFLPNKGIPLQAHTYPLSDAELIKEISPSFAYLHFLGGCCGTTPETIALMKSTFFKKTD